MFVVDLNDFQSIHSAHHWKIWNMNKDATTKNIFTKYKKYECIQICLIHLTNSRLQLKPHCIATCDLCIANNA